MTTYTLSIIVEGHDRASGPLGGIGAAIGRIGEIAGGILAAGALVQLGQGILSLGSNAINATAQMQAFEMGLQTLVTREIRAADATLSLDDAFAQAGPRAQELSAALRDIAIASPYELGQVQDTFRLAMAFGFASDEAQSFTRGLLNMAAGVGASNEMLGRMAYNFAQIRMQGRVTAVDIRQLAMAGLDLNAVLKDIGAQFGVTINDHNDFNRAIAEGKIKWEDFAEAFEKYADKNFGGAAERMSRTFAGLKSTFSDIFLLFSPAVFGPALQAFTDFANEILNRVLALADSGVLEEWGKNLGDSMTGAMDKLRQIIRLFDLVKTGALTAGEAFTIFFTGSVDNYNSFMGMLDNVRQNIGNVIRALFAGMGAAGGGLFAGLSIASLAGPLMTILGGLGPALAGLGASWGSWLFTGLLVELSTISPALGGAFFRMFMIGGGLDTGLSAISGLFGKLGTSVGGFFKFLMPLAPFMGSFLGFFALAALALTGFGLAMKAISGDTQFFQNLLAGVQNGLGKFGQFWAEQGPAIAEIGGQVWGALVDAGNQLAEMVIPWLVEQFNRFSQWFVDNGPLITEFIGVLATFFTDTLLPAIVGFWTVVEPILTGLFDAIGNIATAIMQLVTGDFEGAFLSLQDALANLWTGLQDGFAAFLDWVTGWFGTDWETVKTVWLNNWEMFNLIVSKAWENIKTAITTKFTEITTALSTWWANLITTWTTNTGLLVEAAKKTWETVKTTISDKISEIANTVSNGAKALYDAGVNMLQGLLDGIQSMAGEIISFAQQLAADIADAFAGVLDMHSPSRVFIGYGENIVQGLANGIRAATGLADQAIGGTAQAVMSPFSGSGSAGAATYHTGGVTIIVNGAGDPEAVAEELMRRLQAQGVVPA